MGPPLAAKPDGARAARPARTSAGSDTAASWRPLAMFHRRFIRALLARTGSVADRPPPAAQDYRRGTGRPARAAAAAPTGESAALKMASAPTPARSTASATVGRWSCAGIRAPDLGPCRAGLSRTTRGARLGADQPARPTRAARRPSAPAPQRVPIPHRTEPWSTVPAAAPLKVRWSSRNCTASPAAPGIAGLALVSR